MLPPPLETDEEKCCLIALVDKNVAMSKVDGDLLERQYRNHLSGYLHWDQLVHAEDWLLFEKNIGAVISKF